ncbi:MAG: hypothetical protein J4F98_16465 [Acidobacteria bacterium]|nr:hypothetical protein [Acidobacteriota bacterium]
MARIEPGVVVALPVDEGALFRWRTIRCAGRVAVQNALTLVGFDLGRFLRAEDEFLAALGSALEGRQRADVVPAGEVGLAVWRSGNLVGGC